MLWKIFVSNKAPSNVSLGGDLMSTYGFSFVVLSNSVQEAMDKAMKRAAELRQLGVSNLYVQSIYQMNEEFIP